MITKYNKYIKESLSTKTDIKNWLDSMRIRNYTINNDLTVDVDDDVDICAEYLIKIPFKFNKVNGNYYCNNNKLISLEGSPTIIIGQFDCSHNNLTSLEGCPTIINIFFDCSHNKLTSLEGCPTTINGEFYCHNNSKLVDINDLDSKILIKNINHIIVSQEVFDKYFEHWIDKDINILSVLKNKVSDNIKQKYSHLFQTNNFDLF